jgi:general secretion pathway protein F/type IV pilus assembly protein PilC
MPDFSYEAMAPSGERTTGTLTAGSEREALAMIDSKGLFPIKVQAVASASASRWSRKVKTRHMATMFAQLADLLHSGVPLLRSLELLERQTSQPVLKEVINDVRAKVADGTSLADAMAQHPNAFNELTVSMVRAGQEGGFLEDVLKRTATFTEHQEDMRAKVVGAMAYPVFLAVVGLLVLNILVIFFVPRFEAIFKKLEDQGDLPTLTIWLMAFSNFLQHYGLWLLLGIIAFIWWFRRWARSETGRYRTDGWRLKLPGFGHLYRNFALARFARILGTLLHNGIPILQSLHIAKDSTGNKVLAEAIEQSAQNVTAGEKLAAPLAANQYFPKDLVEMVAVAEEANTLETVLVEIADGIEKRTGRQLELFVRLLEPVMLLVMAAVTLVVVMGLLLPVFKMGSAVR